MQQDLFHAPAQIAEGDQQRGDPTLHQWFTPFWAAEMLTEDALSSLGRVGVVEPSCGTGAFLAAVPAGLSAYGVDIDPEVARKAQAATGRPVIVGDFQSAELPDEDIGLVLGNPPFSSPVIDGFLDRSHEILPEDGVAAFILPAYVFSTASRVMSWNERFALDVKHIPRSLFGRISHPLVWAKFIKSRKRTMMGLLLFSEQQSVENMPKETRRRLGGPGTWREAVHHALDALGGRASLREIYNAVEPRRPTANQFWRDKVRQTLGLYFTRVDDTRWTLPERIAA
ncbi:methyltransferase domain-containing protein [Erythrobacter aureus]|uniref:Class I SAM-dependent methyltransferase n=1 Tax=Erythrobacter aureus TaxID=2182384 RepID=A0A345YJ68_9SPHN|nr:class I SAM-dependent methyltransferase [Erythrobacter aureus]AXK43970.1 class I SAM-dependent methyltransferase [Erythrobacter aureus]